MIKSPQTAFILGLVVVSGLALGWVITRPSFPVFSARTAVSPARLPAISVDVFQAKSLAVGIPHADEQRPAETHAVELFESTALPTPQSLFASQSVESVTPRTAVSVKSPTVTVPLRLAKKTGTVFANGFAPLPLPALRFEGDVVSVNKVTMPAVLAAGYTTVALDAEQKAGLETLADDFAEKVGEPPVDMLEGSQSAFAKKVYIAATEADFLIRQRYGHHAYIQMQMEAFRAAYAR